MNSIQTTVNTWDTELYNQGHSYVYNFGESLVKQLAPKKEESIVDLGSGTGELTYKIKKQGSHVIGLDSSKDMVAKAKAQFPDVEFRVDDAVSFTLGQPVDAIFSNAVLHWVTNQEAVAKNMFGNLKKGGRLVVEFGGKGNVQTITSGLRSVFLKHGLKDRAMVEPWYFPSVSQYTGLLEKTGFEVRYAALYDRPTKLSNGGLGMQNWLAMFCEPFFYGLLESTKTAILEEVQHNIGKKLFKNGHWYADYRRIRIVAIK